MRYLNFASELSLSTLYAQHDVCLFIVPLRSMNGKAPPSLRDSSTSHNATQEGSSRNRQRQLAQSLAATLLSTEHSTADAPLIAHTPLGKPYLAQTPTLEISISHSDDYLGLAFSRHGPLGIDLEPHRTVPQWQRLCKMALSEREFKQLQDESIYDLACTQRFLQLWCLKEALAKAAGTGFRFSPKALQFARTPNEHYRLLSHAGHIEGMTHEWTFHVSDLSLPTPHILAVALKIERPIQLGIFIVPETLLQPTPQAF